MPTTIRCSVVPQHGEEPEIIDGLMFFLMPSAGDSVYPPDGREFTVLRLAHYASNRPGVTTSVVVLEPKK